MDETTQAEACHVLDDLVGRIETQESASEPVSSLNMDILVPKSQKSPKTYFQEMEPEPSSSSNVEIVPVKREKTPKPAEEAVFDKQTTAELLTLVQRFLISTNCTEAAQVLKKELEKKDFIPRRFDIFGRPKKQTFDEYIRKIPRPQPSLPDIITHMNTVKNKLVPPVIAKLPVRLFNSKRQNLLRTIYDTKKVHSIKDILQPRPSPAAFQSLNPLKILKARELGPRLPILSTNLLRKETINKLDLHTRILGHLSAVFCVTFDRSGRYIITGADDNLIKIWDAHKGILRCTLRGHGGEICDISVSHENTVLASGSNDKTVRIWCLQTGRVLHIYKCHTGAIASLTFIPYFVDDHRYLVSTGSDCRVVFYKWDGPKKEFHPQPFLFDERVTSGSKIVSMCHSAGGNLVVIGDTHHYIRIYQVGEENIEKIFEHHAHTDRVDSLVWSHKNLRFVSGSKDGTTKVWRYVTGLWKSVDLYPFKKIDQEPVYKTHPSLKPNGRGGLEIRYTTVPVQSSNKKNSYKLTMLCWTKEDDFVVSAGTDYILRIWNWENGQMLRELKGHENDAFVLCAHPIFKEYIFSAGHDGFLIIWDVYKGTQIKKHINADPMGSYPIFDFSISADGTLVAFVDSMGYLSILGIDRNDLARTMPKQQFFSTDYRPLYTDHIGYVIDADSGLAPHLMDPPIFVNIDLIPHDPTFQKMIPGNDTIQPEQSMTLENTSETQQNPAIQELLVHGRTISRCPWISRPVVAPLRESQIKNIFDEKECFTEEEKSEFEREKAKYDPSLDQRNTQNLQPTPTQRAQRSNRRSSSGRNLRVADINQLFLDLNRPRGRARDRTLVDPYPENQISDPEDENYTEHAYSQENTSEEDTVDDEDEAENDEDDINEDSDYEEGRPVSTVFRPRTNVTVTGRRKRSQNRNGEQSEPSSQPSTTRGSRQPSPRRPRGRPSTRRTRQDEEVSPSRPRRSDGSTKRKKPRLEQVALDDPELYTQDEPEAPTSSKRARKVKAELEEDLEDPTTSSISRKVKKVTRTSSNADSQASQTSDEPRRSTKDRGAKKQKPKKEPLDEIDHIDNFPEWMRQVRVNRFPYVAQLGDQVVYCLQGHQGYLNAVEAKKIYKIPRDFDIRDDLNAEEFCIVDELEYRIKPYRTIVLKLAITDAKGRRKKGEYINVMYHDMEGYPDFLLLRQHYDISVNYKFDSGSAVEALIDDRWWVGRVQQRRPHDEDYPLSHWMSLIVAWDTGEEPDPYCPWDLQPKKANRKTNTLATQKDYEHLGAYKPVEGDWPLVEDDQTLEQARDYYLKRAQKAISQLYAIPDIEAFKEPVDLGQYPSYSLEVAYPADLQVIGERINNKYYRRLVSLLQDIQYIAINAGTYNDENTPIVDYSYILVETLFKFITEIEHENAAALFEEIFNQEASELKAYKTKLRPRKNEAIEPSQQPSTSKASSSRQTRQKEPFWIAECRDIMEKILTQEFRNSLFKLERSGFFNDEQETFDQLVERLNSGEFKSPKEFEQAVEDLAEECKNYNDDRRSQVYRALLTFQSQFKQLMKQVNTKYTKMTDKSERCDKETSRGRPQRTAAQHAFDWMKDDIAGPSTSSRGGMDGHQLRERQSRGQKKYNTRKREGTHVYKEEDSDSEYEG